MRRVRVDPAQGPVLAAGAVLLAAAVAMLNTRMNEAWGNGVHLVIALAACAFVAAIALMAPRSEPAPAYQSVLALAALALLVFVLGRLAQVFGVDAPFGNSGTIMWVAALYAAAAGFAAHRFASVPCAFIALLATAAAALAFVDKVFNPDGLDTFRWILLVLAIAFTWAAAHLRRGPRAAFAVQAVNVVGLMLVGIAGTFVGVAAAAAPFGGGTLGSASWGWKAILVLGSLAVLGYAALRSERGPGYIGLLALVLAIVVVTRSGETATILGWPLILLLAAAGALAVGLRPSNGNGRAPAAPPPTAETRQPPPAG